MLPRWMGQCLAILATGLVGMVVVPGCAETNSMLFIRQVLALQQPDCIVRNGVDQASLFSGRFDASIRAEYTAELLVGNQLVARGSSDLLRTESSRVALKTAEVTVEDSSGAQIETFSVPVVGFIDQAVGVEPSFGVASATLVSGRAAKQVLGLPTSATTTATAEQLAKARTAKRLVSRVRLFGETLGGSEVQSNEFQFVVFVCHGCLVNYPPGVDPNPTDNVLECTAPGVDDIDPANICCRAGQDCVSDCRALPTAP